MTIHYLVAHHRTGSSVSDTDAAGWAAEGEPVVPNLPVYDANTFMGLESFKAVPYARVTAGDFNLDEWATALKKQFPGLPPELHETYILETVKAAMQLDAGTVVQAYTDADSARLRDVEGGAVYTLWEKQPLPARCVL